MGYQLRRDLREALGPSITGLQRAVALEIADDANEETRESWVKLEDLARWTGAKDATVVRNALKRLAAAGWEFRVPIGKGKDGRVLYAVPGRRMTFVVPPFEGGAGATPSPPEGEQGLPQGGAGAHSEGATATPQDPQGGAGAHSEGATAHSEGAGATPFSSTPSSPQEEEASTGPSGDRLDLTEFGAFWLAHPKSRDRDKTLAAWKTAVEAGADPKAITAAAIAYAREAGGENWRYIKHSANWLRERRYEDKYEPERRDRPPLRAVSGDYQPWINPTDPEQLAAYENGF